MKGVTAGSIWFTLGSRSLGAFGSEVVQMTSAVRPPWQSASVFVRAQGENRHSPAATARRPSNRTSLVRDREGAEVAAAPIALPHKPHNAAPGGFSPPQPAQVAM